ncbi:hypothetical protein CRG98_014299 [Punica granatum]|uniref:LIM zinc-binding domain-containing protein n=1 Tax=Punica granatum TaxID=22663 RepID=A0A2I0K9W3_PUNGR|nr:hypothetical protein CRG98_014299 [Punica granatum]
MPFGSTEKCKACTKTVHFIELVSADGVPYHKTCFRCSHCNGLLALTVEGESYHKSCFRCSHGGCFLTPSNYAALDGILYCKPHFAQLFKEKGSYNHLSKTASMKKNAAAAMAAAPALEPELASD